MFSVVFHPVRAVHKFLVRVVTKLTFNKRRPTERRAQAFAETLVEVMPVSHLNGLCQQTVDKSVISLLYTADQITEKYCGESVTFIVP
jgi:hypothetical protein